MGAFQDSHIRSDPRQDHIRPAVAVMIRLLRGSVAMLFRGSGLDLQRILRRDPELVDIFASRGQLHLHHLFTVLPSHSLGTTEVLGCSIITFGAP